MKYNLLEIKILYLDFIETSYKKKMQELVKDKELKFIDEDIAYNYWQTLKCNFITLFSKKYPDEFKLLPHPPLVVYYFGNIAYLNKSKIAIIGSRNNTLYGKNATKTIIENINNKVIVSGMAFGIDQIAHKYAIKYNLPTIAIIGSGLDNIYPHNKELINKLIKKGLILSEYPPSTKACPWMFPMRNRLIAALSSKILVMEAGVRSGSLITVEIGLELNKEIYALPGSVFSLQSQGTNLLIEEGANILTLASFSENEKINNKK